MTNPLDEMTDRQRAEWPGAVADVARYGVDVDDNPYRLWQFSYDPETRPGRGRAVTATFTDGEHFAEIRMDVYGHPTVNVAETQWLHNSSNEECPCEWCVADRDDE